MSYCKNCGAYIPEGEQKCLACGYIDSTAVGIAADKNTAEGFEKSVTKSSALGERLVTRYSSRRREGGKGAARRYSSKRKGSQNLKRDTEDADTEKYKD